MDLSGRVEITAARDRVWATLIEPGWIRDCSPGIDRIDALDATHFEAHAKLKLGFFSVGITVHLERLETDPQDRVVLAATGRAAGSEVTARGDLRLSGPDSGPTTIDWKATLAVSGAAAGIGDQVIESSAQRMVAEAVDCLRARLEAPTATDA